MSGSTVDPNENPASAAAEPSGGIDPSIRSANQLTFLRFAFWLVTAVVLIVGIINLILPAAYLTSIDGASFEYHFDLVLQSVVGLALVCTGLIMFTAAFVLEFVRSWRDQ